VSLSYLLAWPLPTLYPTATEMEPGECWHDQDVCLLRYLVFPMSVIVEGGR